MNKYSVVICVAFACAFVGGQSINDINIDDGLKKLQDKLPDTDGLQNKAEDVLREKCQKNGAEDAVDQLKNQQEAAHACVEKYVNVTLLQEELDKAKTTGSMDEVFGKYCKRWPDVYDCLDNATAIARQCMDGKEEAAFNKTLVILNDLQEFLCFKDGDRLAMFVAEGGVECIQSRKEELQECANATLGDRIPKTDDLSITSLPTFFYSARDCEDFDKIRECFNVELEKCEQSTPANIVDAFFKFVKKQLPCGPEKNLAGKADAVKHGSSASSFMTVSSLTMVFAAFLSICLW